MAFGIRFIKALVKKFMTNLAHPKVEDTVPDIENNPTKHPLIWIKEHIQQLKEINPRFPWVVYLMGAAAIIVICLELYVTVVEYIHGEDPNVKVATEMARRRASKRKKDINSRNMTPLKEETIPRVKKVPRVDLGEFLTDLYRDGITVKRMKDQNGNSPKN